MKLNTWHFRIRDYTHLTITNFGKKWLSDYAHIYCCSGHAQIIFIYEIRA